MGTELRWFCSVLRTGKSFWQTGNRNDDDNPTGKLTEGLTDRVAYDPDPQDSGMVPVRHRQP